MASNRFDCPVHVPEGLLVGEYANAVRVMRDGSETLLDFLVYSDQENQAVVVACVRMRPGFLVAIRDRIDESVDPTP